MEEERLVNTHVKLKDHTSRRGVVGVPKSEHSSKTKDPNLIAPSSLNKGLSNKTSRGIVHSLNLIPLTMVQANTAAATTRGVPNVTKFEARGEALKSCVATPPPFPLVGKAIT